MRERLLIDGERACLQRVYAMCSSMREIFSVLRLHGATVYLVGGTVRDMVMNELIADIDVEVHGISLELLQQLLKNFGTVMQVGKSFGVIKIVGIPIDWAIPRRDKAGRKPEVELIPFLSIEEALRRRDLTMNAMAIDVAREVLIDPFNGYDDILQRRLRSPDHSFFGEDPLRFFRVMQFVSRCEMYPDELLNNACRVIDISGVSRERVVAEFEKLLLRTKRPSWGIRWLRDVGRLQEVLPELSALIDVPQERCWHPEGDVFEHTMQVVDAAARHVYDNQSVRMMIVCAALCHDVGKAVTTKMQQGRIRSIGHESAGVPIAMRLMHRIALAKKLHQAVALLVRHHMAPVGLIKNNASSAAYKRLAYRIAPHITLELLALLAYADKRGRNGVGHEPLDMSVGDVDQFVQRAREYGVLHEPERPLVRGDDLVDIVDASQRGTILSRAYAIQINQGIGDKHVLLKRVGVIK